MKKERVHIQSLMRALDILEVVRDSKEPIRATEIARLTGLGVATAHNIIRTLYARNYLAQNNKGRYMLGALCLQLKSNCEDYFSEIRAASKAVIEELSKETGDTTFLGCELDGSLVCAALSQGDGNLVAQVQQNWLSKLHCTGAGKVIIAEKGIDWFAKTIEKHPLQKLASQTIMTLEEMQQEVDKIKRQGYSFCNRESSEEVSALGIPVYRKDGGFIGALAQAVPRLFLESGAIDVNQRVKILRRYAAKIADKL